MVVRLALKLYSKALVGEFQESTRFSVLDDCHAFQACNMDAVTVPYLSQMQRQYDGGDRIEAIVAPSLFDRLMPCNYEDPYKTT